MPGNKSNLWVLLWNLQFVRYIQPMSPSLRLYFTFHVGFFYFFQMVLSFPWMIWFALLPPNSRAFPAHTGHRRFPADHTDPTTQQVQPVGSDSDSCWVFAVFCHLVRPYNHPCSSRSSSFWSSLLTLRPFFPREPELKGKSVRQFPSPHAARLPPTHKRETKTAVIPHGKYTVSWCHTAVTIPTLENPAVFHLLVPPLHTHTQPQWAFSHLGAANSLIIAYLLSSDCCSQPDLCSQVKVQLEKISSLFRSILFLICCCRTKFPMGFFLLPIAFPLLL